MATTNKRASFLVDIARLILFAESRGIYLICSDFDRSKAEQEAYVLKGFSQTMTSRHLKWQAMDFSILEPDGSINFSNDSADYGKYELLGKFWESLGSAHVWGAGKRPDGTRKDLYHFELN